MEDPNSTKSNKEGKKRKEIDNESTKDEEIAPKVSKPDDEPNFEYCPNFLPGDVDWFSQIEKEVEFTQGYVKVFGKVYPEPRLTAMFADPDKCDRLYKYSGTIKIPKKMTPCLCSIRDLIKEKTGIHFDFVLLNLYRNNRDSVDWHCDNEPGQDCSYIASVSLGGPRKFKIRFKKNKVVWTKILFNRSLFLMKPGFQEMFHHQVPRETGFVNPRINLTFRRFK